MRVTTTKVYSLVYKPSRKNSYFGLVTSVVVHIVIFLLLFLRQERIETTRSLSVTLLEEEKRKGSGSQVEEKKPEEPKPRQMKVAPNIMHALKKMAPPEPPRVPVVTQKLEIPEVKNLPQEPGVVPPIGGIEIKEVTETPGPQAQIDISDIAVEESGLGGEIVVGRGVPTSEILKSPVHKSAISIGQTAPEYAQGGGGGLMEPGSGGGGGSRLNIGVKIEESTPPPVTHTPGVKVKTTPGVKKEKRVTFEISGSIANRKILYGPMPSYPSWAAQRGAEAVIVLRLYVTPEGRVKSNIVVFQTSGYPEWDDMVRRTVITWKFEALPPGTETLQSGYITFRFILE
jgi:TonB family protein